MNRLLVVVVLVVVGIAGLGFYLKWWSVGSGNTENKPNITFTLDKDKIGQDEKKTMEKVKDLGHSGNDKPVAPAASH